MGSMSLPGSGATICGGPITPSNSALLGVFEARKVSFSQVLRSLRRHGVSALPAHSSTYSRRYTVVRESLQVCHIASCLWVSGCSKCIAMGRSKEGRHWTPDYGDATYCLLPELFDVSVRTCQAEYPSKACEPRHQRLMAIGVLRNGRG